MEMTFDDFQAIPFGAIIRVVKTKYQDVEPGKMLTFVVKKGGGHHDWAIYYSYNSVKETLYFGTKVMQEKNIRSIFPCSNEIFERYRF